MLTSMLHGKIKRLADPVPAGTALMISLWLALRVMALTVVAVVRRRGITSEGAATATEFSSPRPHEGEA